MIFKTLSICSTLAAASGCPELARLVDLIQELSLSRSAARIVELLGEENSRLLHSDGASLILNDGEHWYSADGIRVSPVAAGGSLAAILGGLAIERREPFVIPNLHADERIPARAAEGSGMTTALAVPIRQSLPIGAICVYWAQPHAVSDFEVQILQTLAEATSAAVEVVRAHAELEARVVARTAELEREASARTDAEHQLQLALEAGGIGTWDYDARTHGARSNGELLRLLGYRPEDIDTVDKWMSLVHADDQPMALANLSALTAGKTECRSEFRLRTASGDYHWVSCRMGAVEHDGLGRALRILGTITDINEHKLEHLALQDALNEAEHGRHILDALMAYIPVGLVIADADGRVSRVSRAALRMIEHEPLEAPATLQEFVREDWQALDTDGVTIPLESWPVSRALRGEFVQEQEVIIAFAGGKRIPLLATAAPIRDGNGSITGAVVVSQDISQHKQDQLILRESEERFRATFDQAAVGIAHVLPAGNWLRVNSKLQEMLGYTAEELRYRTYLDVTHPDDREIGQHDMRRLLAGEIPSLTIEKRYVRRDGSTFWARVTSSCVRDEGGAPKYCIGVIEDITEAKQLQETIRQSAQHDPLTGLATREFGGLLLASADRGKRAAALLFIDLDRFKPINDTYGHDVGDDVLRGVARRLRKCVRSEDVLARLGGDEFVALVAHVRHEGDVVRIATHILESLAEPYAIRDLSLDVSPSIGISLYPHDGKTIDELLRNADTAMYHAKATGRNRIQFFRPELDDMVRASLHLEARLRHAVEHDEFRIHYQPIHDMETGRVVGAEALLRWPAGKAGPDRFMPLIESGGYGPALCRWVVGEVCRQRREWQRKGIELGQIGVNVSASQFGQANFAEAVREAIGPLETGDAAICIEVPEAVAVSNVEKGLATLRALRDAKIKVALTDCHDLESLRRLPADMLKVQGDLLGAVASDQASAVIASAMLGVGRSLGMDVVAEHVDSLAVVDFLRERHCRKGQGFYFSHPLPADEFEQACLSSADGYKTPLAVQ